MSLPGKKKIAVQKMKGRQDVESSVHRGKVGGAGWNPGFELFGGDP